MRMTTKEAAIIRRFIQLQKAEVIDFRLYDLAEWLYDQEDGPKLKAPTFREKALAYTLRNLGIKLERRGCAIIRTSPLGRGNSGKYELSGNFSRFIEELENVERSHSSS